MHRLRGAAHFVLDSEQVPAAVEIDDVLSGTGDLFADCVKAPASGAPVGAAASDA